MTTFGVRWEGTSSAFPTPPLEKDLTKDSRLTLPCRRLRVGYNVRRQRLFFLLGIINLVSVKTLNQGVPYECVAFSISKTSTTFSETTRTRRHNRVPCLVPRARRPVTGPSHSSLPPQSPSNLGLPVCSQDRGTGHTRNRLLPVPEGPYLPYGALHSQKQSVSMTKHLTNTLQW